MALEEIDGFIVFSDLKGFSKLTDKQQKRYLSYHVEMLSDTIKPLLEKAFVYNTWGDAIIAIFKDGMDACEFMLTYREETKFGMPAVAKNNKVLPRIAGHFGKVRIFEDPLLDRNNTISNEVNIAARIEPVTRPGEIFVSKEFMEAFYGQQKEENRVKFEYLGKIPLAKGVKEHELYRLISSRETPDIIAPLFEMKLSKALPEEEQLSDIEKEVVHRLNHSNNRDEILAILKEEWKGDHTGLFSFEIAKVCKKAGFYREGLKWVERAQEEEYAITEEIKLYPYKTARNVIKLKADLLTRLEQYEESAEILYSLWKNIEGHDTKDASEILAMLAAQFKRRAIMKNGHILPMEDVDKNQLERAASLYLDAFRHDMDNYYPAINAAYLLVLLGGEKAQSGKMLARYIKNTWQYEKGSSHWLDFTLAETELIQGIYFLAANELEQALKVHGDKIGIFDIESTKMQISQFLRLTRAEEEGKEIIQVLDDYLTQKFTSDSLNVQ